MGKQNLKPPLRLSRKLLTAALLSGAFLFISDLSPVSQAIAEEGSGHSGGHGGGKGGGHGGGHGEGEEGHSGASGKGHEGGHGGAKSVENKVLRQSGGGIDTHRGGGGRPVWAGGGIPEDVELGRLNVARSPEHVLNKALNEAHEALQADPTASPHSPLQNLALYKEALSGQSQWTVEQAAAFLGAAADKNIPITTDTVRALNTIMGLPTDNAEGLAQAAEQVRLELKAAHDAGGEESGH